MYHQKLGKLGEAAVVRWIRQHGGVIVARNYHTARGELDVVAWWQNSLCFIEVKTRSHHQDSFGGPEEALDLYKLDKFEAAAEAFLRGTKADLPVMYLAVLAVFRGKGGLSLRFIELGRL